jgi:hypothetical protein
MTEERLRAAEGWAGYPDRDQQAARIVCELVREVRRLQREAQTAALDYLALEGQAWEQPAALPLPFDVQAAHADDGSPGIPAEEAFASLFANAQKPFRGILDGITAETVYGVHA